jgi:hypothetical protein
MLKNDTKNVIYKITHKPSGKCYIGKTEKSFSSRWASHFTQGLWANGNKFKDAINSSNIADWLFEIVESVDKPCDLSKKETYWINHYNSIEEGLNSTKSIGHKFITRDLFLSTKYSAKTKIEHVPSGCVHTVVSVDFDLFTFGVLNTNSGCEDGELKYIPAVDCILLGVTK